MNQNKNSSSLILVHHGILGQKWGVRRYQNPDGTLTPEGRERYGYEDDGRGQQQAGEKKSFVQRHKKALIVGGAIIGAIAISKGVNYFQNRQGDRIDEIVKAYEKSWNKHALSNRITTWKNGGDWSDVLAQHNAAMSNKINSLYSMKYSDLANEARRVKRVLRHSEGDDDE